MTADLSEVGSPGDVHDSDAVSQWREWVGAQGAMGVRVAGFDWGATSLGPISAWPEALRVAVGLCLSSAFPMAVWCGPELLMVPNEASRGVFGDRFELALGRGVAEVWPEVMDRVGAELEAMARSGRSFFVEDSCYPFDRSVPMEECFLTYSYAPIIAGGSVAAVVCTFLETTANVLARRRLAVLAQLGAALAVRGGVAQIAEAVIGVLQTGEPDHPAGALLLVSDQTETIAAFGEGPDTDVAADLARACLESGSAQHMLQPAGLVGGLHAYPIVQSARAGGGTVLLLGHHARRPWDDGLAEYFELLVNAIAGAWASNEEYEAQQDSARRLAELDAAKSTFFAGVSHELRTPLSLVAAPLEQVLEGEPGLPASARSALRVARVNVDRLVSLVDGILDFSRLEAGKLVPHLADTDVSELARGLAASFQPAFDRAGLAFGVDIGEVGRTAFTDSGFIERIVSNLLSNALKYTPSGRVELRLSADDQAFTLQVSDTGVGIAKDDLSTVFDRFVRLPQAPEARAASGTGIGLSMVRELVRLLGGTIEVDSALGAGSVFTVRLPFALDLPAGSGGQSVTPRTIESFLDEIATWLDTTPEHLRPGSSVPRPRVLVAEDDAHLGRYVASALAPHYEVQVVGSAEAAIEMIQREPPDLVLTDVTMPGIGGIGLVRAIRKDPRARDLPVVFLSGHAGAADSAEALHRGADDYIVKPFRLTDLRSRVAANLERARERVGDMAWRRALLTFMHDPMLIFDRTGQVLEMNAAFTELFGYTIEDGPFLPPYPWWPTPEENAEELAAILERHTQALQGIGGVAEFCFYDRNRKPVWIALADAKITHDTTTVIRTFRNQTREKQAQWRRAAAARVSDDFSSTDELETLLTVAEHGYELLFEGTSTIQLDADQTYFFSDGQAKAAADLDPQTLAGLAGQPSPDTLHPRPGILLVHASGETACRAWIQFPRPRRIGPDELIVADLLAKAFAISADRIMAARAARSQKANLELAVESHRLIGQAVGVLVERHRLTPSQAFDRLKTASQRRNLKVRELARRTLETGLEPEQA